MTETGRGEVFLKVSYGVGIIYVERERLSIYTPVAFVLSSSPFRIPKSEHQDKQNKSDVTVMKTLTVI